MDTRRIEAAIMNNVSDIDYTMTPFEAGLRMFVDLNREDEYFGKVGIGKRRSAHTRLRRQVPDRRASDRRS